MTSSFYRGEEMKLCQMYFQSEAVYSSVSQLGEMGVIQFKDVSFFHFFLPSSSLVKSNLNKHFS